MSDEPENEGPVADPTNDQPDRARPTEEGRPVEVRKVPERMLFEARIDGRPVGRLDYHRVPGGPVRLVHTEVDPVYSGRGIGSALAKAAIEDARTNSTSVDPVCPFVARWLERHPEYQDLIAQHRQ